MRKKYDILIDPSACYLSIPILFRAYNYNYEYYYLSLCNQYDQELFSDLRENIIISKGISILQHTK